MNSSANDRMIPPNSSREAAKECSPQRKLWVNLRRTSKPRRGERKSLPTANLQLARSTHIAQVQSTLTSTSPTMILIAPRESHENIAKQVTGLLFVLALFIAPVVGAIPAAATAPALIIVGSMMVSVVGEIAWHDPEVAIPAFLTMMTIPLTFSIANGLAFGFTAYSLLKILRGKFRQVNWFVYLLTALFILRFLYVARAT